MQEFIERLSPKVKKLAKKALWILAGLIAFFTIVIDLDKPGEGYIRLVFHWALSMIIACYTDVVGIANTPLADLTIAKILGLIVYVAIGIALFGVGRAILSFLFWALEKLRGSEESD